MAKKAKKSTTPTSTTQSAAVNTPVVTNMAPGQADTVLSKLGRKARGAMAAAKPVATLLSERLGG